MNLFLEFFDNYSKNKNTNTVENPNTNDVATYIATSEIHIPSTTTAHSSSVPYDLHKKCDKDKNINLEIDYTISLTKNKDFTYMIIFIFVFIILFVCSLFYIILNSIDLICWLLIIITLIIFFPMLWYIVLFVVSLHKHRLLHHKYNGYKY